MLFYSAGNEGDTEPAFLVIIIGSPVTGEFDRGAHLFENLEIIVEAAFGDADLVGAIGGFAGGFEMDEIVETDEPMQ